MIPSKEMLMKLFENQIIYVNDERHRVTDVISVLCEYTDREPETNYFFTTSKLVSLGYRDKISIDWHIQDIQERVEETDGKTLSDDDARLVLHHLERQHDANYGITWEHIDYQVEAWLKKGVISLIEIK